MNQTRVFLIFAWLMVATLLWMEWGKENAPPPADRRPRRQPQPASTVPVPGAAPMPQPARTPRPVPTRRAAPASQPPAANAGRAADAPQRVTVSNDVLRLTRSTAAACAAPSC